MIFWPHYLEMKRLNLPSEIQPAWKAQHTKFLAFAERRAEEERIEAEQKAAEENLMTNWNIYAASVVENLPWLLHNVGISYTRKFMQKGLEEEDRLQLAEVDWWRVTNRGVFVWMRTNPLPTGVTKQQFLSPEISETLSLNLNRDVIIESNGRADWQTEEELLQHRPGLWIIIYHNTVENNIPKHVKFMEIYQRRPRKSMLEIPAGIGLDMGGDKKQKDYFIDLDRSGTPHMIVGGTTGGGKSVFLNNMMSSLLLNAHNIKITQKRGHERIIKPAIRFFMVDLKQGLEFERYQGLEILGGDMPFIIRSGKKEKSYEDKIIAAIKKEAEEKKGKEAIPLKIVDYDYQGENINPPPFYGQVIHEANKLPLLMWYVRAEVKRRGDMFRAAGILHINDWNKKNKDNQLSRIVMVFDEAAEISTTLPKKEAEQIFDDLASIAATARALGVSIIICTQYPSAEIIPNKIKANFPVTVAFYCKNEYQSRTLVGNNDARDILSTHPGEGILDYGTVRAHLQTPFQTEQANRSLVKKIDHAIKTGKAIAPIAYPNLVPEDIFAYALEFEAGHCSNRKLFQRFSPQKELERILRDFQVEKIDDDFKPIIEINRTDFAYNGQYVLSPSISSNIPRKLIPLDVFTAEFEEKWENSVSQKTRGVVTPIKSCDVRRATPETDLAEPTEPTTVSIVKEPIFA